MTVTVRSLTSGCKIEDESRAVSFRLNAAGHWSTFRSGGNFYRRCVDGRIVRGAAAESLDAQQTSNIYQQAYQSLQALNTDEPLVQKSCEYSPEYYLRLGQQYFNVYHEPVSILPPDRYADLVVQPAKGCPNRQCSFCIFYKDKPYSVLNKEQLQQHLTGLKTLFAEAVLNRQGVFLGSANSMALSQRRLRESLQMIQQSFGSFKRGVATFADPDFSAKRTAADWQELYDLGLRHVVIGLETGWGVLRAKLGKSDQLDKVEAMIAATRFANISVGLTLLTGITEINEQQENAQITLQFLQRQLLDRRDMIYLSPLQQHGLVSAQADSELKLLSDTLKPHIKAKVVHYQMQRFNYYA
ncbi:hypothetical protein ACH42_01895 [Endozoicomonas sp. (ex Bugula neritina AB1)]|nr:hypothetical protein ACH42_01895 [Endozoicomonas sp. (ex Bugula neritina AB1)]